MLILDNDDCDGDYNVPNELCKLRINLKGPYSPLEITATTFTRAALHNSVVIENESVNSILLDTDPQDLHEKLIVAGCVGTSQQKLVIRQTTMMPNIPGLPALIGLLFAPNAKIIFDEDRTRVVSILFGLGYDENTGGKSLVLNAAVQTWFLYYIIYMHIVSFINTCRFLIFI